MKGIKVCLHVVPTVLARQPCIFATIDCSIHPVHSPRRQIIHARRRRAELRARVLSRCAGEAPGRFLYAVGTGPGACRAETHQRGRCRANPRVEARLLAPVQ